MSVFKWLIYEPAGGTDASNTDFLCGKFFAIQAWWCTADYPIIVLLAWLYNVWSAHKLYILDKSQVAVSLWFHVKQVTVYNSLPPCHVKQYFYNIVKQYYYNIFIINIDCQYTLSVGSDLHVN